MTTDGGTMRYSLRKGPELLLRALVISLLIHLFFFGGYELGKKYDLWDREFLPAWLRRLTHALTFVQVPKPAPPPQQQQQIALQFVDVPPDVASAEAPKNATHYSSRNSVAANADAQADLNVPKLDGTQTHVPKTEDVPRTKMFPLRPSMPRPQPAEAAPEQKPAAAPPIGDLAMAKPATEANDTKDAGNAAVPQHERPRTLAEAKLQQAMAGEMMRQDGGVRKQRILPSFDAIGTPFGEYDAEIINAIQLHWDDLIDSQAVSHAETGRVVLQFRLNYDGRVTDMKVIDSTVDELLTSLCELAVTDPAPYARWPNQMRLLVGADYREVRFTFFYD
jgi:outer membrane biosynthesis protein TonB